MNFIEVIYADLFAPMNVTRLQFKKLVGGTRGMARTGGSHFLSLHSGECYAIQDLTKTDRLAICLSGRVNVLTDRTFLHSIHPGEFLDSPEFESSGPKWAESNATESTFKVNSSLLTTYNIDTLLYIPFLKLRQQNLFFFHYYF